MNDDAAELPDVSAELIAGRMALSVGMFDANDEKPRAWSIDMPITLVDLNERVRTLLAEQLGEWYHHADGRDCRESYGWCFTHMRKALLS